jgi:hypothetical protein
MNPQHAAKAAKEKANEKAKAIKNKICTELYDKIHSMRNQRPQPKLSNGITYEIDNLIENSIAHGCINPTLAESSNPQPRELHLSAHLKRQKNLLKHGGKRRTRRYKTCSTQRKIRHRTRRH